MAQVKKADMRDAILASAFDLFSTKGYSTTTVADIARASSMTVANLYVYFPSKLLLLYAVYTPWLRSQVAQLREAAQKYRTPRTRLKRVLLGIWRDIPSADHCLANALIDALSSKKPDEKKPDELVEWAEIELTEMLLEIVPEERRACLAEGLLSHCIWMAFDGFSVNRRLGRIRDVDALADIFTDLILGSPQDESEAAGQRKATSD